MNNKAREEYGNEESADVFIPEKFTKKEAAEAAGMLNQARKKRQQAMSEAGWWKSSGNI